MILAAILGVLAGAALGWQLRGEYERAGRVDVPCDSEPEAG